MFKTLSATSSSLACICVSVCGLFSSGSAFAQATPPFGNPTRAEGYTLSDRLAIIDLNDDGSPDFITPGFFQTAVTTLDEDGVRVGSGTGPILSPVPGSSQLALAITMAGGKLDSDHLTDLVAVSQAGGVHVFRNLGSNRVDSASFTVDTQIDSFVQSHPVSFPISTYSFPYLKVEDFDNDGRNDILLAGGTVNYWSAATHPGFLCFYKGLANGGFQRYTLDLPGAVIDAEFADLDGNGTKDQWVVLTETGSMAAFLYEVHHVQFTNGALHFNGFSATLGFHKPTSMELVDVIGTSAKDYVFSQTGASGSGLTSNVYYIEGDGMGNLNFQNWGTFYLPANPNPIGDHIPSIKVADFNQDGADDIAILRGYIQPPPPLSSLQAQYANSDLMIVMGPQLAYANVYNFPLHGWHSLQWASQSMQTFNSEPQMGSPNLVQTIDLGADGWADLVVAGVFNMVGSPPNQTTTLGFDMFKNTAAPTAGRSGLAKVGNPTGGTSSHKARLGFGGGQPKVGNLNFHAKLQNVRGGSIVGLMWGSYATPGLLTIPGMHEIHVTPEVFGGLGVATGSLLGQGTHVQPLAIPNQPSLVGGLGYFQYNYYDVVSGQLGGSQGTGVWIGP